MEQTQANYYILTYRPPFRQWFFARLEGNLAVLFRTLSLAAFVLYSMCGAEGYHGYPLPYPVAAGRVWPAFGLYKSVHLSLEDSHVVDVVLLREDGIVDSLLTTPSAADSRV